jgi:hypothetical protein
MLSKTSSPLPQSLNKIEAGLSRHHGENIELTSFDFINQTKGQLPNHLPPTRQNNSYRTVAIVAESRGGVCSLSSVKAD